MVDHNSISIIAPIILLIIGIFFFYLPDKFDKWFIVFNLGELKSTKAFLKGKSYGQQYGKEKARRIIKLTGIIFIISRSILIFYSILF